MAGIGPPPKPAALRQRRNKVSGAAMLPAEGSGRPAPPLPDRPCVCTATDDTETCQLCDATGAQPWHPLVLKRWADVWASPMAAEYLEADVHGLYVLADLWDLYWRGDKSLAAEIRLQEQRFGLSSLDRRRLQWEVERVEQSKRRPLQPPSSSRKQATKDPRSFLRAVR